MDKDIKPIAFYLPQFHEIPENDKWWGKGFTEWLNVKKSLPLFKDHNQPRIPHEDIGYYDLTKIEILEKQAKLAKKYGIYGFCFYHYFFDNKKRLLEKPVDNLLNHPEIKMPFCLCWANEPWSRRWDGSEKDILMPQNHSDQNDLDFIINLKRYITDERYIKINNKPIILIYRSKIFPNIKNSISKWREWCLENGVGEICMIKVASFDNFDNHVEEGYDYLVEFPPHSVVKEKLHKYENSYTIYSYEKLVRSVVAGKSISEIKNIPKVFKTVMLEWDNTARMRCFAKVWSDFSFELYEEWLQYCIEYTTQNFSHHEQLLFINAWNEWGEGTYLEPDCKNGYKALEITSNIINKQMHY